MKFFKMFESRLMNEAGEGDGGGSSDSAASASQAYEMSSQASISEDDSDSFRKAGLDPAKYGIEEDEGFDDQDEESQGSDDEKVAGQATDEKSILDIVNSLELIHNENPFQVGSKDELKNLLQMGRDYTLKTQSLSEERKAWETERSNAEKEIESAIEEFNTQSNEFGQRLQELEQWTFTINQLKEEAPDIFHEVQRAYEGTKKQFSNPILDRQLASIKAELAETKKGLSERENKLVLDSFDSDYAKVAPLEQSFKELGITVNKDDVKKEWARTGLAPEQVIGMLYGTKAMQAQASKGKVEQARQKVSAKPTGSAGSPRTGKREKAIDPKLSGMSYANALWDRYSN